MLLSLDSAGVVYNWSMMSVISVSYFLNENPYLPQKRTAFKINSETSISTINAVV